MTYFLQLVFVFWSLYLIGIRLFFQFPAFATKADVAAVVFVGVCWAALGTFFFHSLM